MRIKKEIRRVYIRLVVPGLVLSLIFSGRDALAQEEKGLEKLINAYFLAGSKKEEKELTSQISALVDPLKERETFLEIEKIIQAGGFYQSAPIGRLRKKVNIEYDNTEAGYVLYVPLGYEPGRAWPLLVGLHGAGDVGEEMLNRWGEPLQGKGFIVACPTFPPPYNKGYGATETERSLVLSTIKDIRKGYHIDSNSVFLAGVSRGGHMAWDVGLKYSDYFAGIIVECGTPVHEGHPLTRYFFLENAMSMGIYQMQGTPDPTILDENHRIRDIMQGLSFDYIYREFPGAGHGIYEEGTEEAVKWLLSRKREPYPRRIVKIVHRTRSGRAYWLKVEALAGPEYEPKKRIRIRSTRPLSKEEALERARRTIRRQLGRVEAEIKGNEIHISASHTRRLSISLNDHLVNMDEPVLIYTNGRLAYRGLVKRNVALMLKEAKRERDMERLFWGRVNIPVR